MTIAASPADGTPDNGLAAAEPATASEPPTPVMIRPGALAALLRPVRGRLILAGALAALSAACGLIPFIAVAEIARALLADGPVDQRRAWTFAWIGAAAGLARFLLIGAAGVISHYADTDLQLSIRTRLARHLGTLPLGWFTARGSGEVKKAVQDDVSALHHLAGHAVNDLAAAITLPLAGAAYLFVVDWRMALVTLAVIPAAMVLMRLMLRDYGARMARYTEATERINNEVVEYINGMAVVKTFGQGGRAYRRFARAVDDFADQFAAWVADVQRASAAMTLVLSPCVVLLLILAAGMLFVERGWLSTVELLPFLLVGVGLPAPWIAIGYGVDALRQARLAATHVQALLDEPPLQEPAEPRLPEDARVELDDVHFSYVTEVEPEDAEQINEVLRGVDAVLEPATLTALVGPSGSGKTTLARLIPRFWDVTGGAVRIGGVDVRAIPTRALLARVAIVFQDIALIRDTARENIRLARPDATDAEVEAAARAAQVHEVIAALPQGYDTVLGEEGGGLSGGERQRVSIARAILQDAPIVVLDEATAFADPESEAVIQEALSTLIAGRTVLVIAHRLWTIAGADQILVLERGAIVERGRHAELLAAGGLYARLWAAQQGSRGVEVTA